MPEKETVEAAQKAKREGKAPSTQAGEFVHAEIEHVREGKHGARSPEQAIAIGLSKARRAGVKLPAPKKGRTSAATRKRALRDVRKGQAARRKPSPRRARAVRGALKREGRAAVTRKALGRQARRAARELGPKARKTRARNAVRTKGPAGRRAAARKAARTRARSS